MSAYSYSSLTVTSLNSKLFSTVYMGIFLTAEIISMFYQVLFQRDVWEDWRLEINMSGQEAPAALPTGRRGSNKKIDMICGPQN